MADGSRHLHEARLLIRGYSAGSNPVKLEENGYMSATYSKSEVLVLES